MTIIQQHTPVLIVGAGPSGLMMAAQLLRYGTHLVIIDSKQGPTDESKALAVQARSMEIYRQLEIVDKVLHDGSPAEGIAFSMDDKPAAAFSFDNIGEGLTPFPYVLMYPQSKNERVLLDFLTVNCCPVYWETSLVSLKQGAEQVEVEVTNGTSTTLITCDWLIGADGARSMVRKQLGLAFNGETYASEFYLADVSLNNSLKERYVQLYLGKDGFAGFFPMPEAGRFRLIGNLPPGLDEKQDLKIEDILPALTQNSGIMPDIRETYWFTTYRLHHRMADKFRLQRCFLIGDAAHIHSPVGGQGMNTGLQDAYNLAWKLAGVINGQTSNNILDSYAEERMPVAKTLLKTTDNMFSVIMSRRWYMRLFKRFLLPRVLKYVWSKPNIKQAFFKRISQIEISYRDNRINLHMSPSVKIKAGDRIPYLKIYDEKKEEETDLHAWCAKPGFTLIILGKLAENDLFTLAKWVTQTYGILRNFYYLPYSTRNRQIFEVFEINPNKAKSLIIRPDMHIGFINDKVDMVLMDNYLKNVVGAI